MSVQLENGYTKIANELLEALAKHPLNGTQRRILDVVFRYTYGFNRKEHDFSIKFLMKAMDFKDGQYKQVCRELKSLIDMKILREVEKPGKSSSRIISFNKCYDLWTKTTSGLIRPVDELDQREWTKKSREPLVELDHQEIKDIKKTLKKDICASEAHKEVIQYFCDKHLWKTGIKYLFDGGKDGKTIQTLLKTYDTGFAKGLIDWYFQTDDEFINKIGYSIGKLKTSVDKYIAQMKGGKKDYGSNNEQRNGEADRFYSKQL